MMANKINQLFIAASLLMLVSSCSSVNLNPFSSGAKEQSLAPKNAVAYVCDGNKQFYLRMLNNGNDAWLIYPDHEVNLAKSADNNGRYTSGVITLLINANETTLNDGDKIAYTGCKSQAKK
jgi:hypothetical protein